MSPPPPPSILALASLPADSVASLLSSCTTFLITPSTLADFQTSLSTLPLPPKQQKAIGKTLLTFLPYATTYLAPTSASLQPVLAPISSPEVSAALLSSLVTATTLLTLHVDRGGQLPLYSATGAVSSSLATVDINKVTNLSWSFGVTAATDALQAVGSTYLQLNIETSDANGQLKSTVLETDVKGLYSLMSEMERIKSMMAMTNGE